MSKRDTLKTAKRVIQAIDMAQDGYQDKDVKKAQRKERQVGKKLCREGFKETPPSEDDLFLKEFVEKYGQKYLGKDKSRKQD